MDRVSSNQSHVEAAQVGTVASGDEVECRPGLLSVVMVVRNGGAMLEQSLASCSFASEIVVVDDFSQDNTVAIAERFGARVFRRALDGDWAAQQNFAMQQATCPWVLLVDHDEVVSPELAASVMAVVQSDRLCIYSVKRINRFVQVKVSHGMFRPDWVVRLFPRVGTRWEGCVHSSVVGPYPTAKLTRGVLYHCTVRDLPQYWYKMMRYAELSALKYQANGRRIGILRHIVLRPIWSFFQSYFLWLGFLDGVLGWYFAWQYASYTMNKYMQLYILQRYDGNL